MPATSKYTTTRYDLTPRLKARQAAWQEESSARPSGRPYTDVDSALAFASVYATRKLLDALYANVPPPADASRVSAWDDGDGQVSRYFRGTKRGNQARVDIAGSQNADGTVTERVILVGGRDIEVDATGARQIAADLLAAADELDWLARTDNDENIPPVPTN
jgi:hypothetical protein